MHARRLIERHFDGRGLSAAEDRRMRAHLRGCAGCRASYDRLAQVTRAAAGRAPTQREAAVVWAGIERGLAPRALTEEVGQAEPEGVWRWLPAVAVAAVVGAVIVGVLGSPAPVGPRPGVQLRGGAPVHLVALEAHGVRALPGGGYATPRLLEDGAGVDLAKDLIQLRYRNQDPRLRFVYVFALDRRLVPLDYYPRPSSGRSVSVEAGGEAYGLGRSIRLSRRHQAGPLRVVALFSERALSRAAVHGALSRWKKTRGDETPLPATLDLELAGAGRTATVVRSLVIRSPAVTHDNR